MKKNEKLNKWLWKWHFIAGLISLPFILVLSITGGIYLFKTDYEKPKQQHIKEVTIQGTPISLQDQWEIASKNTTKKLNSVVLSTTPNQATEFISGRFGGKSSVYINPYTGTVSGKISSRKTDMFKVRKLHGELLLGKFGTTIVELIASWMVVLILTGLYIWWPSRGWKLSGFFIPRIKEGKRTFFRDLHSIIGFWFSGVLLLILAGGFPWTDVFGDNFKQIQKITNTGFPSTWHAYQTTPQPKEKILTLDQIASKAKELNLPGVTTIHFPKGLKGVFSISNNNLSELNTQKKIHVDPYSGKELLSHNWSDIGILMRGRMWVMAFHQGQFGAWSWWLMLLTAVALTIMCISGLISYIIRKRKGAWGIPNVPKSFKTGYGIIIIIAILGIIFPLFGMSILPIFCIEYLRKKKRIKKEFYQHNIYN
ncbi:PepSY-associated TM helix domain-containing protein [Aquimarina longa]|uniref:PepSY-associated TM helix domain-containing protein n=1 Tax=Aquimarina longa TaxID=1080221 RepID=UPI000780419F|nr:PepSY domain-containing protein [Aquimarina longa]